MATLEKITVKIYPMSEAHQPYVVTFEHIAPSFISLKLQENIFRLLEEGYVAEGVQNIKAL